MSFTCTSTSVPTDNGALLTTVCRQTTMHDAWWWVGFISVLTLIALLTLSLIVQYSRTGRHR